MSSISASGTLFLRQVGTQLETSSDQSAWTAQSTPLTITNSDAVNTTLVVLFTGTITFTTATDYLICGSTGNIQFGSTSLEAGGVPVAVKVGDVLNYPGLIQNGTNGVSGANSIRVCNLRVGVTGTSTLDTGAGWIGQSYFGNGASSNRIVNCRSEGPISAGSGGIVGSFAGSASGSVILVGCSSSGTIGIGAGGIVGESAADTTGTIDVSQSYSTGAIGSSAGGIIGTSAGSNSGTVRVASCYTLGASIGSDGGGIVGDKSKVVVGECSSAGSIGPSAGGIVGSQASNATVSNSYTTGAISATGGGIYGATYGTSIASTCYTSGALAGTDGGIYTGSAVDGASNFSEAANGNSGTWSTSNALATLQNAAAVVGTVWTNYQASTPYRLTAIGFTPYSLTNIQTPAYTLQKTSTQSVAAGQSSTASVVSSLTHSILLITATDPGTITINTSTGVLSVGSTTPVGSYTVNIMSTSGTSYLMSTVALTVTSSGNGGVTATAVPIGFKRLQYDQFESLIAGNRLVQERISEQNIRFLSYADYMKYRIARSTISTK